ncbi:MAG: hypothetical protein R3F34_13455 [Planctomycetota bacterium]
MNATSIGPALREPARSSAPTPAMRSVAASTRARLTVPYANRFLSTVGVSSSGQVK